ncbi:MAG: pectin methylesterase [Lachnospiraceae bacterium]|nr:pectin methylesterase [Lachnospiraceae bacterium]
MPVLYVGYPHKVPNFETIQQALDSLPTLPETEKTFPALLEDHIEPVTIEIAPGIYEEQFVVERPYVTLLGEDTESTVLTYYLGAKEILEDGKKRGTFRTASVRIDGHDFTAKNLTFKNSAGYGHEVGQALALYVDADRVIFENCRFLGSQDTLFTAPLPPKEVEPGGFIGPGQFKPRTMGRHYYKNCFIRGDVDFIFGGATAYFEDCTIFSQNPGNRKPPESPDEEVIYGYITAASTPEGEKFGYVFKDCHLVSDCPPKSVYLGRPWREFAKTVFLHCELGEHIHPAGWTDWKKTHGHFYYGEYDSYGLGASPDTRADFSHQLTEKEAALYTIENVLGAPDGWNPVG